MMLRTWRQFWKIVDTGGILCQLLFYPAMFASAVSMLINETTPTAVHNEMGGSAGVSWIITLLVSPVVCLAGFIYSRLNHYVGIGLQCAANAALTCAATAYVIVLAPRIWNNVASFAVWIAFALTMMLLCITLRDVRKLVGFEQRAQTVKKASCTE